jgi:hypothetical protein
MDEISLRPLDAIELPEDDKERLAVYDRIVLMNVLKGKSLPHSAILRKGKIVLLSYTSEAP